MCIKRFLPHCFFLSALIVLLIWVLLAWFNSGLPAGYRFWVDDKFWHTAILGGKNIIIPPTVVDHVVEGDFILALKANKETHFSKEHCKSCRTLSSPCAEYWVINWKTHERFDAMTEDEFLKFLTRQGITPPRFSYKIPQSASIYCNTNPSATARQSE